METFEIGEKLEGKDYIYRDCCYGIAKKGDLFLLVYSKKDKNHSLAGGGIEANETALDAIKREFLEEAGYDIKSAKEFAKVHCYWNWGDGKTHKEINATFFLIHLQEHSIKEPLENWHFRVYANLDEMIKLVPFPYQKKVFEILKEKCVEEDLWNF